MCGDCFRIKVCNRFAPNKVAVKCGICKECRLIEQNSWSFRLRCELEDAHSKGWKIGFLTLTFDNWHLPHIPSELVDVSKTTLISDVQFPCFDKSLVRDFVHKLRKQLYDDYGVGKDKDGIKYLICSEYGKHTKRPHHHAVFAFPPKNGLDAEKFFNVVKSKWTYGHIFPRHHLGGVDSHGYHHQPFEVTTNPFGCCKYIAKYISKDLDFFESLSGFYPVEGADLSNYFPFHLQSRSLGFSRLVNLSDAEKLRYITAGYSFIGEDKLVPIPLYFKRKLLFSPKYIFERQVFQRSRLVNLDDAQSSLSDEALESLGFRVDYRRLVRREATDFFKAHYPEIFDNNLRTYTKFFEKITNTDFIKRRVEHLDGPSEFVSGFVRYVSTTQFADAKTLAKCYLAYYGLPITKCFDVEPSFQWFLRYDDNFDPPSSFFRIDSHFYDDVQFVIGSLLRIACFDRLDYSEADKIAARVSDFWNSAI